MAAMGYVMLVIGALVIGFLIQYTFQGRLGYEGMIAAIGAGVGGFVASEYLGGLSTWGTEYAGMYIFPALVGGFLLALVTELALLYATPTKA